MSQLYKIFSLSLIVVGLVVSLKAEAKRKEKGYIKAVMHSFYAELGALREVMISEEEFKAKKNRNKIKRTLERLEKKVSSKKPERVSDTPGFSVSYDMLANHIRETKQVFASGELDYARMKLNAMPNYCITCHTRLPKKKKGFLSKMTPNPFQLPKEPKVSDIEFLFLSRQFETAKLAMGKMLSMPSRMKAQEVDKLLQLKLLLFARVWRNPTTAHESLLKDSELIGINPGQKKLILKWAKQFEEWKNSTVNTDRMGDRAVLDLAVKEIKKAQKAEAIVMDSPNVVSLLRFSGVLYELLFETEEEQLHPELLLNLARLESYLEPLQIYPLNEVYLKQCVVKFPDSEVANSCLSDYEKLVSKRFPMGAPEIFKTTIESLKKKLQDAKAPKKEKAEG